MCLHTAQYPEPVIIGSHSVHLSAFKTCRRQSDSASSLRGTEGSHRGRGAEALNGGSPPSIQEEPAEGGTGDIDQALPPGVRSRRSPRRDSARLA